MIQVRKRSLLNVKPVEFILSTCIFIIFIVVTAFLDEDGYTVSEVDGALEVCVR